MEMGRRRLISFPLICALVLIINTPGSLLAIGEYNGAWIGTETVPVPGYGSVTETSGTVIYQEDQNTLYFFDLLFGAIQLIKSGGRWVLPSPIWINFEGIDAYVTEISITFHSSSYLTGDDTIDEYQDNYFYSNHRPLSAKNLTDRDRMEHGLPPNFFALMIVSLIERNIRLNMTKQKI